MDALDRRIAASAASLGALAAVRLTIHRGAPAIAASSGSALADALAVASLQQGSGLAGHRGAPTVSIARLGVEAVTIAFAGGPLPETDVEVFAFAGSPGPVLITRWLAARRSAAA